MENLNSINIILKELIKLEKSDEFVGVYLAPSAFIDIQILFEQVKETILKDN